MFTRAYTMRDPLSGAIIQEETFSLTDESTEEIRHVCREYGRKHGGLLEVQTMAFQEGVPALGEIFTFLYRRGYLIYFGLEEPIKARYAYELSLFDNDSIVINVSQRLASKPRQSIIGDSEIKNYFLKLKKHFKKANIPFKDPEKSDIFKNTFWIGDYLFLFDEAGRQIIFSDQPLIKESENEYAIV